MANIAWLKDLSKDSIPLVGGKGANLGEMYNSDFPIPNAFVVTSEAYKLFLDQTGIQGKINQILENLNVENSNELEGASEKIQDLILSMAIPNELKKEILEGYSALDINNELIDFYFSNGATVGILKTFKKDTVEMYLRDYCSTKMPGYFAFYFNFLMIRKK